MKIDKYEVQNQDRLEKETIRIQDEIDTHLESLHYAYQLADESNGDNQSIRASDDIEYHTEEINSLIKNRCIITLSDSDRKLIETFE